MKLRLISLIFTSLLFFACQSDTDKETEVQRGSVLSEEVFTNLLLDVQLLEGHLNVNRVNQVFIMDSANNYYKELFDRYEITFETYQENLKYYTAKPLVLQEIYKKVEDKLVLKERLYDSILIDRPAISPINKNKLLNILVKDTIMVNLILDTATSYLTIKDSVFNYYTDSILKDSKTNVASFQQSFNVTTHKPPMFRLFKPELKNKTIEIKED